MPGTEVSRVSPVLMNPALSMSTRPCTKSVLGFWPTYMKMPSTAISCVSPVSVNSTIMEVTLSVPRTSRSWAVHRSSILGSSARAPG